jgi:preprotein translocase subunit SecA
MDHLKEGIGLRGYAQKDPLKEYQREGYDLFTDLVYRMKEETMKRLYHVRVRREEDGGPPPEQLARPKKMAYSHGAGSGGVTPTRKAAHDKVGRNDACPCGSGKKYKKCCGKDA